jgi:hypothetical protein
MKIGKRTSVAKEITRQERNRRNNIKRLTISALVALILFISLTIIQSSILNQETKVSVYQVIADIDSGTKITEDNLNQYLALKAVQVSLIPENYITDSSEIIGQFVNRAYKARDIITTDGLIDTERLYIDSVSNPTEISFTASSLESSVAGTIREGDYVNIYGIMTDDENNLLAASKKYTFKHVYIFKAFDGSGNRNVTASNDDTINSSANTTSMYTVVLAEDDVELFNEMILNCNIRMAKIKYDVDTDYSDFVAEQNKSAARPTVEDGSVTANSSSAYYTGNNSYNTNSSYNMNTYTIESYYTEESSSTTESSEEESSSSEEESSSSEESSEEESSSNEEESSESEESSEESESVAMTVDPDSVTVEPVAQ